MDEIWGFVLAGGRSSRMGEDKAGLKWRGQTLLDHAREKLATVAARVSVIGPKKKFGRDAIEDIFPQHGPLGGIHAALASSLAELNLVLAVDMPFVQPELLKYLVHEAGQFNAVVTVPRTADGWQPLCAVYRREFASIAEQALKRGKNKIDASFNNVQLRIVGEEELKKGGFGAEQFRNLNTPEDLKQARANIQQ